MYETLEHWKQYKQEKELQTKIAKEFKLPVNDNSFMLNDNSTKLVSDYDFKEFDEWMNDLIKKNGTTEYQNMKQVIKLMAIYFYTILVVLATVYCMNKDKECCRITVQEVYEYEGWVIKE